MKILLIGLTFLTSVSSFATEICNVNVVMSSVVSPEASHNQKLISTYVIAHSIHGLIQIVPLSEDVEVKLAELDYTRREGTPVCLYGTYVGADKNDKALLIYNIKRD